MATPDLTLSRTIVRAATCGRCGAAYEYDHEITIKQTVGEGPDADTEARGKAEARLEAAVAGEGRIVPCPACKALTGEMARRHRMIPVWLAATVAGCTATGLAVLWIAGHWGFMFDVVGIGALIFGGLALLGLIAWPFGAYRYDVGRLVEPPAV